MKVGRREGKRLLGRCGHVQENNTIVKFKEVG
jgi:hypothetical protein